MGGECSGGGSKGWVGRRGAGRRRVVGRGPGTHGPGGGHWSKTRTCSVLYRLAWAKPRSTELLFRIMASSMS